MMDDVRADSRSIDGAFDDEPESLRVRAAEIVRLAAVEAREGLRTHRVFAVVLAVGALVRILAMIGNRPALWFGGDSDLYVKVAAELYPPKGNPAGYSFFLLLLKPFHSFGFTIFVQHLLGLAAGALIYALLRRRANVPRTGVSLRLPAWGAALAATPVVLDGYQIQLEHMVMSDALFGVLVVAAVVLIVWPQLRRTWYPVAAMLLLSLAAVTRSIGLPLLLLAGAYLVLRRTHWRVLVASALVAGLPLLAYASWYKADHGRFALSGVDGIYLWSRTATFADCQQLTITDAERLLCPNRAPAEILADRPAASQWLWNDWSPLRQLPDSLDEDAQNDLGRKFAADAIKQQPWGYIGSVLSDFMLSFHWTRAPHPGEATLEHYQFAGEDQPLPVDHSSGSLSVREVATLYGPITGTEVRRPVASWLRAYQEIVSIRGPVLALMLLVGLAGVAARWRDWGGDILLPWGTAMALLLVPVMTADFDHRYVLPALPMAALAAAMAVRDHLARGHRPPARARESRTLLTKIGKS